MAATEVALVGVPRLNDSVPVFKAPVDRLAEVVGAK